MRLNITYVKSKMTYIAEDPLGINGINMLISHVYCQCVKECDKL